MSKAMMAVLGASAALAGGWGDSDRAAAKASPAPAGTAAAVGTASATGALVKTERDRRYGRILVDGRGQALYLFTRERTRRSRCYGACAKAWPPLLTRARPRAGTGARRSLLGTTRRRNGRLQVTYRGNPLYYYRHDTTTRTLCHDVFEFGGDWFLVRPSGRRVP